MTVDELGEEGVNGDGEIADLAGRENKMIFGLTKPEVAELRASVAISMEQPEGDRTR